MLQALRTKMTNMFRETPPSEALSAGVLPPTQAKLKDLLDIHRLSDVLPWSNYDEEKKLFFNDDCFGFALEVAPSPGLGEDPLRVLASLFSHGREAGTNIQISMIASPDILPWLRHWANARVRDSGLASGRNSNIFRRLARGRVSFLLNGAWKSLLETQPALVRDFRIVLSLTEPLTGNRIPSDLEIDRMMQQRTSVKGTLKGAGFGSIDLDDKIFIDLMQGILNPIDVKRENINVQDDLEIREQVVLPSTSVHWGRDSICIDSGNKLLDIRSFSVQEFPTMWAGWQNSELIGSSEDNNLRISCPFMITLTINFTDQLQAMSTAKMKATRAAQMAESPVAKQVPSWIEKKEEWAFVTKKLEEGHTMARLNYTVTTFAEAGEGDKAEHEIMSIYKAAGWRLSKNRFTALTSFLASLPLTAGPSLIKELTKLKMLRTFLTWTAANLAPMVAEWKGTSTPLMLLVGRRGQISYIDPWDNRQGNYNVSVAAASGAGKSVFVGDFTMQVLGTGGKVYTFDSGRSYEKLAGLIGGQFLAFEGGHSSMSLNPFTFVQSWEGDDNTGAERVMLKSLVAQMCNPEEKLSQEQLSWIEEALENVWIAKRNDAEITDVYEYLRTQQDQRKKDLADSMRSFTRHGFYGSYFSGPSNINLNNDYVCLEMKELDGMPELQSVVLLILMMRITQTLFNTRRDQKKAIIVDEAWRLMRGNAGEFIEEIARTCRKVNGALVTITQSIGDYYQSNTALAAFENSDWVFLLRQKESSIRSLMKSDRLPVSEGSEKILSTIETVHGEYSEVCIVSPDGMSIERLYLDPFSEKLLSTKGEEYQYIKDAMNRGEDIAEAVQRLADGALR